MRWNIIKNLFFTNLMYVNPMQTAKYRKKYKGTADIRKKIFNNLLLLNILLWFLLKPIFYFFNFKHTIEKFHYIYKYNIVDKFLSFFVCLREIILYFCSVF